PIRSGRLTTAWATAISREFSRLTATRYIVSAKSRPDDGLDRPRGRFDRDFTMGFCGKGSHGHVGDAAGRDRLVAGEVAGNIQTETVHRNPLADAHPDRGQFPVPDPHAGEALSAPRINTKFRGESNE